MPGESGVISVDSKKGEGTVRVNTKIYPVEVVYSAAYVFIDKAYFLFEGDPEKNLIVTIRPKEKGIDVERLCHEFSNELINYSVYVIQAARKQAIREAIIKKALETNTKESECLQEDDGSEGWLDDPEGIAQPWSPEKAKGIKKPSLE